MPLDLVLLASIFLLGICLLYHSLRTRKSQQKRSFYGRSPALSNANAVHTLVNAFQKKPDWVVDAILDLKARLPDHGCRKIAAVFNRLYAERGVTVGKTFVADTLGQHSYALLHKQKTLKNKPPRHVPRQRYWGVDLTYFTDVDGHSHTVLGVCEHYSRLSLALRRIPNKASITLLRTLLDIVEVFGAPQVVRTDNEAMFTSRLFRIGLRLMGIRHQTIALHSPWQNGRIERLFGTCKAAFKKIAITNAVQLDLHLAEFRFWYNQLRPHQHLHGRTPWEVWHAHTPPRAARWEYVTLGKGAFNGFYRLV